MQLPSAISTLYLFEKALKSVSHNSIIIGWLRKNTGDSNILNEDWIEVKTQIARTLEAPVEAHTEIGAVSYYLNGSLIRSYPIVTDKEVRECTYDFICRYIMNLYLM